MTHPTEAPPRPEIILVATDFSPASDHALRLGWLRAARRSDAELHLVHVAEELGAREVEAARLERVTSLHHAAQVHVQRLAEEEELEPLRHPLTVHIRVGVPDRAILGLAATLDADILVVGSHGKTGLAYWLGSVSRKLLEAAHMPILVARPKQLEHMQKGIHLDPPCPDCVATRVATGGARFWCDVHGREHVAVHGIGMTQRVSFSKGSADSGSLYRP